MDVAGLARVAATIADSALTYRFMEEPARLRFNALSSGRRRAATAPRAEVMTTAA